MGQYRVKGLEQVKRVRRNKLQVGRYGVKGLGRVKLGKKSEGRVCLKNCTEFRGIGFSCGNTEFKGWAGRDSEKKQASGGEIQSKGAGAGGESKEKHASGGEI